MVRDFSAHHIPKFHVVADTGKGRGGVNPLIALDLEIVTVLHQQWYTGSVNGQC